MPSPAAYLRKSKDSATKADHLSMLMASVKAHGHNGDTVVYDDWARSGDIEKLAARTEWRRLCDAIERGDHDVVFMNSLDRGGRSIEEWLRFIRLCRASGVRVIADGTDYSAPENRDRLIFEAWAAEKELDKAKERSARTKRIRKARGDAAVGGHGARYGYRWARAGEVGMVTEDQPDPNRVVEVPNTEGWTDARGVVHPAEPLGPILNAVKETRGNVLAACRLLNERGIVTRSGSPWSPRTLQRIVRSERPSLLSRRVAPIRKERGIDGTRQPAPLSRLVRCHCGNVMTPNAARKELYCSLGHRMGAERHGRYVARDRHVYDALREATEGLREKKGEHLILGSDPAEASARRAELEEKLRRLGRVYRDGGVDDDEYDAESARLRDAIAEAVEDADDVEAHPVRVTLTGPIVHWDRLADDPVLVGDELRGTFREVRLDPAMMPVEVVDR